MSKENETAIELALPQEPISLLPETEESNLVTKVVTGVGLAGVALVCRLSEANPNVEKLPDEAIFMINSGAHPILGFVGGMTGKFVADRIADTGRKAYVGLGVLMAASFDIGTEAAQDVIITPDHPFYSPEKMFESSKDMLFALGGFGIALWFNRSREPNESTVSA